MAGIYIRDTGDLKRVTRQLRQVADGRELLKELRSGLRAVLNPIRDEVRATYGGGHLRGALARATRTEIRTGGKLAGARILVDGRKMPAGMRSLPSYWEGYKRPWRHPVFGNRNAWVSQAAHPTFDRTVEPHEDDATRAVDDVLAAIARKLEAG